MYLVSVIEKLELCPIIAAVHEDKFNDALESPAEIIFLLEGDVMTVGERIYTAGEKEYEIGIARKDGVPINESVQKEIIQIRDELGLNQYKFPWEA